VRRHRRIIVVGLLIAAAVAVSSAWLASPEPDGLERVAQDHAFIERAEGHPYRALPDYTVPVVDGPLSTAIAGLVGVGLVAGITLGAGYLSRRRRAASIPRSTGEQ